jgi:predicted RNA-binding Zn-ribbon protein involved in translation (DUF1610 family)
MIRPASERRPHRGFEKTVHNPCPNCGIGDLTVYFESGSPRKVGALCYSCGLLGFFAQNRFFELGRISETRTRRSSPYSENGRGPSHRLQGAP